MDLISAANVMRAIENIAMDNIGMCETPEQKALSLIYTICHSNSCCGDTCPVVKEGQSLIKEIDRIASLPPHERPVNRLPNISVEEIHELVNRELSEGDLPPENEPEEHSELAKRIYDTVNCFHAKTYGLEAGKLLPLIDNNLKPILERLKKLEERDGDYINALSIEDDGRKQDRLRIATLEVMIDPFAQLPVDHIPEKHRELPMFVVNGKSFTALDVLRAKQALEKKHGPTT